MTVLSAYHVLPVPVDEFHGFNNEAINEICQRGHALLREVYIDIVAQEAVIVFCDEPVDLRSLNFDLAAELVKRKSCGVVVPLRGLGEPAANDNEHLFAIIIPG